MSYNQYSGYGGNPYGGEPQAGGYNASNPYGSTGGGSGAAAGGGYEHTQANPYSSQGYGQTVNAHRHDNHPTHCSNLPFIAVPASRTAESSPSPTPALELFAEHARFGLQLGSVWRCDSSHNRRRRRCRLRRPRSLCTRPGAHATRPNDTIAD